MFCLANMAVVSWSVSLLDSSTKSFGPFISVLCRLEPHTYECIRVISFCVVLKVILRLCQNLFFYLVVY